MNSLQLSRQPLYVQAHDRLLTLVEEGDLQPGDQLPAETQLADQMGISRATLREALRLLEEEGVIVRRQGVGTFVAANRHLESGLERLESVLALAARQGLETQIEALSAERVAADRILADHLQVDRETQLTRVRRTVLIQNEPVAYLEDFIPTQWLPPEAIGGDFAGSVLDLLRHQHPDLIQEALADITAVTAGRPLSAHLGISPGVALLLLEETLFDASGAPIGFSRNYFVPDRFRFHVVRR
ncbi:MAG: GntR family transcriptional regulator [Anaerolineae bacterium]|jgi:GntR family transcriptional regulator